MITQKSSQYSNNQGYREREISVQPLCNHNHYGGRSAARSAAMFWSHPCKGGILIVDDDPDCRKIIRKILERDGYHVLEAEDGEKAIEVVKTGENPLILDLVIMDIELPKIDGVEAIKYIQKDFPRVQLCVLTGRPDLGMATLFIQRGLVDYLVKPIEGEILLVTVEKAMDRRQSYG